MSLLIKGLKMPKEDELLYIRIYPSGKVTVDMDLQCKQVAEAVELTDHGDLVDVDTIPTIALQLNVDKTCTMPSVSYKLDFSNVPVVIPAEKDIK